MKRCSIETSTKHNIRESGKHTLKVWMVDAGLVIQKVVVRSGQEKPTYLKPPETGFVN
jgi:hypothetical protein